MQPILFIKHIIPLALSVLFQHHTSGGGVLIIPVLLWLLQLLGWAGVLSTNQNSLRTLVCFHTAPDKGRNQTSQNQTSGRKGHSAEPQGQNRLSPYPFTLWIFVLRGTKLPVSIYIWILHFNEVIQSSILICSKVIFITAWIFKISGTIFLLLKLIRAVTAVEPPFRSKNTSM